MHTMNCLEKIPLNDFSKLDSYPMRLRNMLNYEDLYRAYNKPLKKSLSNRLRSYFLTGILVTAPVVITFWIVLTLVNAFDNIVTPLIPERYNPNTYLPRDIPGIGLVVLVSFLVLIGFITANFFGRWIVGKTEIILQNTPFIKFFRKEWTAKKLILMANN